MPSTAVPGPPAIHSNGSDAGETGARDHARRREQANPQGAGVGLHSLPHVEDRAVAIEQVAHNAQNDERVLGHPPPLPTQPRKRQGRQEQNARLRHARECRSAVGREGRGY